MPDGVNQSSPPAGSVIGIDVGGTHVRGARFDGPIYGVPELVETDAPRRTADVLAAVIDVCTTLGSATAVGVGFAGLVDFDAGRLVWSPHLDHGLDLGPALSDVLGVPVVVDNDANAAALAEATGGSGMGYRSVFMVTIGTGIGGGLVIDGRVERGRSFLGEVGHIQVDPSGPLCACGATGCWEAVASGSALDRAAHAVLGPGATGRDLVRVAVDDPNAAAALDRVARWIGVGLAAVVSAFDPDIIVVGGGVGAEGSTILPAAVEAMEGVVPGYAKRLPTPVVAARFGTAAGVVGAALLASRGLRVVGSG